MKCMIYKKGDKVIHNLRARIIHKIVPEDAKKKYCPDLDTDFYFIDSPNTDVSLIVSSDNIVIPESIDLWNELKTIEKKEIEDKRSAHNPDADLLFKD